MASKNNISVVVDLGTSKIIALAGKKNEQGKIEILGRVKLPSRGIRRGVVYNFEEVAETLKQALSHIESQIDDQVTEVSVAIAGQHMKTLDYKNSKIISEEGVITQFDVDQLLNEAKKVSLSEGAKLLKVIPGLYKIDDETEELNPVGIVGNRLEANYKLLIVAERYLLDLQRVFTKLGVDLKEVTLSTLALAQSALTSDEKEMGAIVLDMGAGTTNLAIYLENVLVHSAVIPFAGGVITKDIKEGCSILPKAAEQLKVQYGEALGDFADDQKVVTIPGHNGWEPKEISFKSLAFIIQARLEEIIDNVNFQIEKSETADKLGAGIVVAGGTANLNNFISLVKFRTGMDVRNAISIINPVYAQKEFQSNENLTALGLLKQVLDENNSPTLKTKKKKTRKSREGGGISPWFTKVVQGVLDYVDDDNDDLALN